MLLFSCAKPPLDQGLLFTRLASYEDLPGWANDNHAEALQALNLSCRRILTKDPSQRFGLLKEAGYYEDWYTPCQNALAVTGASPTLIREFFEYHFVPWQIRDGTNAKGLFTGYYEPLLRGSLRPAGPYQFPLYSLPEDLISVDLGQFREDLKGRRIAGRVTGQKLNPYEDREAINAGNWPHNEKVLVWVDNPVDAFFLHIQGSGRIQFEDGSIMRVGYAGQNGHPYYAIGRELVARGEIPKEAVSLQSIRNWLESHSYEAVEIMNTNKSYVFFREIEGDGPLGGEGLPLTPGRSLAVDNSLVPYGIPVWLATKPPVAGQTPLQRLMIAQDTGGAIRGPVRGDVYWGSGKRAEFLAGQMNVQGHYWFLLPRTAAVRLMAEEEKSKGHSFSGLFSF